MNSKSLNKQDLTNEIKAEALRLGFFACGITWSIWQTTQINDLTPDY